MAETGSTQFEVNAFLANAGLGRRIIQVKTKGVLFSQGNAADSVFYLKKGRAKLVVVSGKGKEATIALFSAGDFIGEEAIAGTGGLRLATAVATTACTVVKIERSEMVRVLHQEHALIDVFLKFLLARSLRIQADLVDRIHPGKHTL
jgi:CRP/FNR family cyclic AMP-dependent transcriptional regulator